MKRLPALLLASALLVLCGCTTLISKLKDGPDFGDLTHNIENRLPYRFSSAYANDVPIPIEDGERQVVRYTQKLGDTNDVVFRILLDKEPPNELTFIGASIPREFNDDPRDQYYKITPRELWRYAAVAR